ncbi:hypothetical protein YC2023_020524 [Brassica napus]
MRNEQLSGCQYGIPKMPIQTVLNRALPPTTSMICRSPVQMPKSDDLSPKKQKPIALGLQCCLKTSTLLGYSVSE